MRRKKTNDLFITVAILLTLMFMIGFWSGLSPAGEGWTRGIFAMPDGEVILGWYLPGEKGVGIPGLSWYQDTMSPAAVFGQGGIPLAYALEATAEPETTLPYPDEDGTVADNHNMEPGEGIGEESRDEGILEPLVAIYCTHNAECYAASSGVSRLEGKNGGVFQVAKELKAALDAVGVETVLCDTIHDYPDWALSYQNSLASMQKLKAQYPSLEIFIDVHRDAAPIQGTTVYQNESGEKAAKIMLIVGSDKRLEHPNWQENLGFSQKIGAELEEEYPGIMRGVRVQSGRYNQHFSPKAILVEMGSTENTLTEAKKSADILARALKIVIEE